MIGRDHTGATYVVSSALALGLIISSATLAAFGAETPVAVSAPVSQALVVSFVNGSTESTYSTHARTVAAFLEERAVKVASDDYLSPSLDSELSDGARVLYRPARAIELRTGRSRLAVRSAAPTVAAFLEERGIALSPSDEVRPALASALRAGSVVRVVRITHVTKRAISPIAPPIRRRWDPKLALGTTRVLAAGSPGLRETTVRFERRDDGKPTRAQRSSRVVRAPRERIVVVGTAPSAHEFEDAARAGFGAAVRLADSALQMMATAYTAGCYGCSGITSMGLHAGHGIVAVDPRVIPLGTKLYVPGYGPAIAGDTGGDIRGKRIDLGFNSLSEAIRFGRRQITVYVLH